MAADVPVLGVRQAWVARVGPQLGATLAPHVAGNTVFVAANDGSVTALDGRTGQTIWSARVADSLSAGIGSDGVSSAVVSRDNQLILIADGKEVWRKPLSSQVYTVPVVAGGRVFVLAADRSVSAFDVKSGARLWNQQRPGDALILRQPGVLRPVGNTLVAGLSGRLVGLNPDNGGIRWETPIASPRGTNDVERLVELVAPVSRQDENVCARAFQATVGCVSVRSGSLAWSQPASGAVGLDGDADAIYGAESNGSISSWSRVDGRRVWSTDRLKYRQLTAPLLLGRSVVVGDSTGLVHWLSRTDGAPLARMATDGSSIVAAPVVVADTLVAVTRNGNVYGFRPD